MRGLKARGGFEIDISWRAGTLTSATIRSTFGAQARVHHAGREVILK